MARGKNQHNGGRNPKRKRGRESATNDYNEIATQDVAAGNTGTTTQDVATGNNGITIQDVASGNNGTSTQDVTDGNNEIPTEGEAIMESSHSTKESQISNGGVRNGAVNGVRPSIYEAFNVKRTVNVHQAIHVDANEPADIVCINEDRGDGVANCNEEIVDIDALSNNESDTDMSYDDDDDDIDLQSLPDNVPDEFAKLCRLADKYLCAGRTIYTTFEAYIFGHEVSAYILRRDLRNVANIGAIACGPIVYYMRHLYDVMQNNVRLDTSFSLVDPNRTNTIETFKTIEEKAMFLSERYGQCGRQCLYLIPRNKYYHWTLTVVDLEMKRVFMFDPLKGRLRVKNDEWRFVVDESIKSFYDEKFKVKWICPGKLPTQTDNTSCGYYVMKYMRDIVSEKDLKIDEIWNKDPRKSSYSIDEINELRRELADIVLKFIVDNEDGGGGHGRRTIKESKYTRSPFIRQHPRLVENIDNR
ncbi:uncharacterized protein [Euphorbia lathyris]|uniref:uncharacterized protein n=1 Tax=Euphorbia lathyris TaxID=212925 RepID=UPI003313126D